GPHPRHEEDDAAAGSAREEGRGHGPAHRRHPGAPAREQGDPLGLDGEADDDPEEPGLQRDLLRLLDLLEAPRGRGQAEDRVARARREERDLRHHRADGGRRARRLGRPYSPSGAIRRSIERPPAPPIRIDSAITISARLNSKPCPLPGVWAKLMKKPCRACTLTIATSITTISPSAAGRARNPTISARPPRHSTSAARVAAAGGMFICRNPETVPTRRRPP